MSASGRLTDSSERLTTTDPHPKVDAPTTSWALHPCAWLDVCNWDLAAVDFALAYTLGARSSSVASA